MKQQKLSSQSCGAQKVENQGSSVSRAFLIKRRSLQLCQAKLRHQSLLCGLIKNKQKAEEGGLFNVAILGSGFFLIQCPTRLLS